MISNPLASTLAGCPPPRPFPEIAQLASRVRGATCDPFAQVGKGFDLDQVKPSPMGKLTPFWAQEEAGTDLAADFLDDYDKNHGEKSGAVTVGMMDSGIDLGAVDSDRLAPPLQGCKFNSTPKCQRLLHGNAAYGDNHGTYAANLMVGPKPIGSAARAKISALTSMDADDQKIPGFDYYDACHAEASCRVSFPKIVNTSMVFSNKRYKDTFKPRIDRLASRTLMVMGSGNDFPVALRNFENLTPGIVVGSVAPNGLVSNFSQDGAATPPAENGVTICAPSDNFINSTVSNSVAGTQASTFSGTSAAAPMVSGACSNVMSLLPDIPPEQNLRFFKGILKNTAIRTAGFKPSVGQNGAGSLNGYQMVAVAARLKAGGWPKSTAQYALADVENPASRLFDFAAEARSLSDEAKAQLASGGISCENFTKVIGKLRRAFFLAPNDGAIRASLALVAETMKISDPEKRAKAVIFAIKNLGPGAKALLKLALNDSSRYTESVGAARNPIETHPEMKNVGLACGRAILKLDAEWARKVFADVIHDPTFSIDSRRRALNLLVPQYQYGDSDRLRAGPFTSSEIFDLGSVGQPPQIRRLLVGLVPHFAKDADECVAMFARLTADLDSEVRTVARENVFHCSTIGRKK